MASGAAACLHSLIVQGNFDAGIMAGLVSPYVTGEFGAGLVETIGIAGGCCGQDLLRKVVDTRPKG